MLGENIFRLVLSSRNPLPEMLPGQFVQIKVDTLLLRRPISLHDVDYADHSISMIIQIVGRGTQLLSQMKKGEQVDVIFPLGNSFTIPSADEKVLLIGGGVGIAPLLFLGKYLLERRIKPQFLFGYRTLNAIFEHDKYMDIGKVYTTTEDGSFGVKGFVTEHPIFLSGDFDRVYCCGPDPMMRAVAAFCRSKNITCEVSLENKMACGIGACLCCVTDTINGNVCTCTEGPIFNIDVLKW